MKIQTIEYEELFPTGVYANQRYRAIGTMEDGDDFTTCFKELKDKVEKTFIDLNPQIQWKEASTFEGTIDDVKLYPLSAKPKDERISSFIATINMCSSKKFLENFSKRVSEENNPELTEAFNNKLKTFE